MLCVQQMHDRGTCGSLDVNMSHYVCMCDRKLGCRVGVLLLTLPCKSIDCQQADISAHGRQFSE
jgi:hypothetical protein